MAKSIQVMSATALALALYSEAVVQEPGVTEWDDTVVSRSARCDSGS
jgi:hypothetical protein